MKIDQTPNGVKVTAALTFEQRVFAAISAELERVYRETRRQDAKFGPERDLSGLEWLGILSEEVGEVSKDLVDAHWSGSSAITTDKIGDAVREFIQVAAVAVQAAASLRRQYPVDVDRSRCGCKDPNPIEGAGAPYCITCGRDIVPTKAQAKFIEVAERYKVHGSALDKTCNRWSEAVGMFCACIDPAPRIHGALERCDNCGGITKEVKK